MKKGSFYILITGYNVQKVDGYLVETARNKYGIHNRSTDSRYKRWIVTDILTGCQITNEYSTRQAAAESITARVDDIAEKAHRSESDFNIKSMQAIATAYQENPITQEKRRPIKNGYIIEYYTTTDGTNTARATISPAAHPDYIYMDIPEADLAGVMEQIKQDTPRAYFIDRATGEEIILLSAKTPTQKNRIPRKFSRLYITILKDTTAGAAGTRATVYRNQYGDLVEETETGKIYACNLSMLRLAEFTRIDHIETEEAAPVETDEKPITKPENVSNDEETTDAPETAQEAAEPLYKYGMRLRGYSIGAQPTGVVNREDDPSGKYYDIITYKSRLTPEEVDHYSLDPLTAPTSPETDGATTGADPAHTTGTEKAARTDASTAPDEIPTNDTRRAERATDASTPSTERPPENRLTPPRRDHLDRQTNTENTTRRTESGQGIQDTTHARGKPYRATESTHGRRENGRPNACIKIASAFSRSAIKAGAG